MCLSGPQNTDSKRPEQTTEQEIIPASPQTPSDQRQDKKTQLSVRSKLSALSGSLSQVCVGVLVLSYITHVEERVSPRNEGRARTRRTFDSKRRLWTRSEAKICRRRHFHTNRPYCVSSEKKHTQTEWDILTCVFPLCAIAARWSERACVCMCVCQSVCIVVGTNSESMRKAWEVVYQQNSPQRKYLQFVFKGNIWRGTLRKSIKDFFFYFITTTLASRAQ